jgi:predicted small secreted protein
MKLGIAVLSTVGAIALAGCNTMEGMGQDIQRGGQAISQTSRDVRADWRGARAHNEREYDTARRTCAGLSGTDRDACLERAHERYAEEMNHARAAYPQSSMQARSDEDRREDAYDAARDRCESLRGAAEDQCIADARARFRQ